VLALYIGASRLGLMGGKEKRPFAGANGRRNPGYGDQ
jgi:hypothetical protein